MKTLQILFAVLCVTTTVVSAQDGSAPIELVLKFDPAPGQVISGNLAPYNGHPFYLVIKNGEAFLSENETPKQEIDKHKGTVQFIHRNGVDPGTHARTIPIFELRFRYVGSGWREDRVVTEIMVPYSVEQRADKPTVVFSETATEDMLSEEFHKGNVLLVGDMMGVRYERRLTCTEISSKLGFSLK